MQTHAVTCVCTLAPQRQESAFLRGDEAGEDAQGNASDGSADPLDAWHAAEAGDRCGCTLLIIFTTWFTVHTTRNVCKSNFIGVNHGSADPLEAWHAAEAGDRYGRP